MRNASSELADAPTGGPLPVSGQSVLRRRPLTPGYLVGNFADDEHDTLLVELDVHAVGTLGIFAAVFPEFIFDLVQIVVLHRAPGSAEQRRDLGFGNSGHDLCQHLRINSRRRVRRRLGGCGRAGRRCRSWGRGREGRTQGNKSTVRMPARPETTSRAFEPP